MLASHEICGIKIKFYGMYSHRIRKAFNPQWSPNAIFIKVGQIIFARKADLPSQIYIIKIIEQDKNEEKITVNYSILRK